MDQRANSRNEPLPFARLAVAAGPLPAMSAPSAVTPVLTRGDISDSVSLELPLPDETALPADAAALPLALLAAAAFVSCTRQHNTG